MFESLALYQWVEGKLKEYSSWLRNGAGSTRKLSASQLSRPVTLLTSWIDYAITVVWSFKLRLEGSHAFKLFHWLLRVCLVCPLSMAASARVGESLKTVSLTPRCPNIQSHPSPIDVIDAKLHNVLRCLASPPLLPSAQIPIPKTRRLGIIMRTQLANAEREPVKGQRMLFVDDFP